MIGKFIKQTGDYKSFIPADFPDNIKFKPSDKLLLLDYEAALALGKLDGASQLVPSIVFFSLMYSLKEATLSSNIEGTKATMHDYLKVKAKINKGVADDVTDIINLLDAFDYGFEKLNDWPLASRLIKVMHSKLLSEAKDVRHRPGEFRQSQNWIGGGSPQTAIYVPPPHPELSRCLSDLDNFINQPKQLFSNTIRTGITHAQFEAIHPFLDGNGRIGRLIIVLQLCQDKVLERPILYMSEYFKRHRQIYFAKLNNYRNGDIEGWLEFFLVGLKEVAESAIATIKELMEIRENDLKTVNQLGRQATSARKLLDNLYKQPMVSVSQAAEMAGITRQAGYGLVGKMVEVGILKRISKNKASGSNFIYEKYVQVFN